MQLNHAALALSVYQALLALASPRKPFAVQDSIPCSASGCTYNAESAPQPLAVLSTEVHLDDAVFVGIEKGNTHQFLGIPFAYSPTGDRRLRQPEVLPPYSGLYYAQAFGRSCPQQKFTLPNVVQDDPELTNYVNSVLSQLYQGLVVDDEDCLTINIVKPSDASARSMLPVVVWIFGGAFEIGGTSTYDGANVVSRSIDMNEPVIFVSMNYRLSAFGFLPGKEVKEAGVGNLGLQDQRLALKWVQTYISEFGGDPSKVTIWGESAGAISVALHMITNNGNQGGLFRGAVMQSGGPIPVGSIENGQIYYDYMVERTGCKDSTDTLACLRRTPYSTFKHAMDGSPDFLAYQGLVLAWLPRVDGLFLTESPPHAVLRGHVSSVPMITGDCDDEGTLFSFSSSNLTTTADVKVFLKSYMMANANDSEIDLLLKYYPDDQRAGSPFDTGRKNVFSPQFKRISAIQGDFVFHGPRRLMLKSRASKQPSWAFVSKRGKDLPYIGAAHATDLLSSILVADALQGELRDYVIRFVNNLDPNGKTGLGIPWPRWDPHHPKAIVLQDSVLFPIILADDNYRTDPLDLVANLSLILPV